METNKINGLLLKGFSKKENNILIKEIFHEQVYKLAELTNPKIIIDAGAYTGIATCWFKSVYPDAKVIAIEPNWASFEILKENIALNGIKDIEILNVALGKKNAIRDLFFEDTEDGWNSTSSFFQGGWREDHDQNSMTVKVIPLSEILKNIQGDIDLIKMDIEGAEQSVLYEVADYLDRINNMIIEFHPVTNQSLKKIKKLLIKGGYKINIIEDKDKLASKGDENLAMIYATKEFDLSKSDK